MGLPAVGSSSSASATRATHFFSCFDVCPGSPYKTEHEISSTLYGVIYAVKTYLWYATLTAGIYNVGLVK
jgi:hypothetical protein